MADLNEPKKETVRITLPPQVPPASTPPAEKERARINLPNRPPGPPGEAKPAATRVRPPSREKPLPAAGGVSLPSPIPPAPGELKGPGPLPPPPGLKQSSPPPSVAPPKPVFPPVNPPRENRGATQIGPRKETARLADSPMKATVKLGSVQPVNVPVSPFIRSTPPIVANPRAQGLVETIPTQLCWVLLIISALILLIQLWTYFA